MKLLRSITNESQGPISVRLILDEIINAGKVTNPYQLFVLGWVSEFFKHGLRSIDLGLEQPITFDSKTTSTELVSALKAMDDSEHVALAEYLKDCIKQGTCPDANPCANSVDWMRYLLASHAVQR